MLGGGEIKGWRMELDVLDRFAKYARQGLDAILDEAPKLSRLIIKVGSKQPR